MRKGFDGLTAVVQTAFAANRLPMRLTAAALFSVADIPRVHPTPSGSVAHAHVATAVAAHRPTLQQRRAFPRRRGSRQPIVSTVALKEFEVFLEPVPGDVAGVRIRNACEPVVAIAGSLNLYAFGGALILTDVTPEPSICQIPTFAHLAAYAHDKRAQKPES